MRLTIGKKLGLSFGVILLLMVGSAVVTYLKVQEMGNIQDRVVDLRFPTVRTGDSLLNGINRSLAALRGYMILGSDPTKATLFKNDRRAAWESIDSAIADFERFAKNWTVPANVDRLNKMKAEIEQFRVAQQEVENISHTDDNVPAFKLLLTDAAPRAGKILKALTAIINEEETLEANSDRKLLLKYLADTRGSFAVGLANIRAYLLSGDVKFRKGFEAKWAVNEKMYETVQLGLELFTPTQREHWDTYAALRGEFAPLPTKMFELRSAKDWNLANAWLGTKAAPRARAIKTILTEMGQSQDKLVKNDREKLAAAAKAMNFTLLAATLVAVAIGFLIAIVLTRAIVSAVTTLVTRAKDIASGDLTGEALTTKSQDELGELTMAMNEMSNALNNLVTEVVRTTGDVASAATQIAASSEEMSSGMGEQSGQITQISSAIEEMSASVVEVARKSADAANSASDSGQLAQDGGKVVEQTIEDMKSISEAVSAGAMSVTELGKRGEQIGAIIEVINDIADQTNLLALNAAIEAARAGEHGRGFAVVADEVRKLADRTTKATEEIGESIKAIQSETKEAVQRMNAGTEQVTMGVERAAGAGQSLQQIVATAQNVASMIQSIAAAAEEQSAASEQVSRNVENISANSRQAGEGADQAASAASQLSAKAEQLQVLVGKFKTHS